MSLTTITLPPHTTSTSDLYRLTLAYAQAQHSPDPSTQNGAIIFNAWGAVIGEGRNDFPACVVANQLRLERPLKYMFVEHAERNAIYQAASNREELRGATMYAAWAACADCARAIIQSGIAELVTHDIPEHHYHDGTVPAWQESIDAGMSMLAEAHVRVRRITDPIGATIRFNGATIRV